MHRHQGLGGRGERRFDLIKINQVSGWVHINEHRCGSDRTDRFRSGEKTEGAGDDLIPRADPQSPQGQDQRIGAAVAADGVAGADAGGKGLLKLLNLRSADVLPAAQHIQDGGLKIRAQIRDLLAEAEGRHLHKAKLKGLSRTSPAPVRGSTSHCSPPRRPARDSP